MLNQETKWTSPSLTPWTKHHPTKITQETAAWGPGVSFSPGKQRLRPLRRPRQACSQFSLFTEVCLCFLSVLILSSFPSLLLLGFLLCRNSYSSDRVPSGFSGRTKVAATSWPWRVSSSWLLPWPCRGSLGSSQPRCCPTGR